MITQGWFIIGFLAVTNVTLGVSEFIRRRNRKKEIEELRKKKECEMVDRADADSLETLSDDDLEDEIEPKQRHIWILGIVICLNIWILGAICTHWWATTFFADKASTEAAFQKVKDAPENEKGVSVTTIGGGDATSEATTRGLFGDSFGAVNALVSAFAFAGMIVAFVLQRYELRLQRKELRDNRAEMRRQTKQFKTQNATLEIQRFENTFFHMLELHKQNLQEITLQGIKGRDAFVMMLDLLKRLYYAVENATKEIREKSFVGVLGNEDPHKKLNEWSLERVKDFNIKFAYGLFFYGQDFHITPKKEDEIRMVESVVWKLAGDRITEAYKLVINTQVQGVCSVLGHYFRHIYQIVCFVDGQKNMKPEEKYAYVKMLRAQLSDYEQILFYYNAISSMGRPWIEPSHDGLSLLTRYRMIKNLPHFYTYFSFNPSAQLKGQIDIWKEKHPEDYFFEQIVQF